MAAGARENWSPILAKAHVQMYNALRLCLTCLAVSVVQSKCNNSKGHEHTEHLNTSGADHSCSPPTTSIIYVCWQMDSICMLAGARACMWAGHEWPAGDSQQQQDGVESQYQPARVSLRQHGMQLRILSVVFLGIKRGPGQCKVDEQRTPCCMLHQDVVRLHVILYDAVLVNARQASPQLVSKVPVGRAAPIPGAPLYQYDLLLLLW